MKFNKVLTLILRLMCGIGIVIPFWYLLVNFVFVVAVGQDPLFDLGNNYVMKHSYVYYLPEKKKENLYIAKRVIAEKVHKTHLPALLNDINRLVMFKTVRIGYEFILFPYIDS